MEQNVNKIIASIDSSFKELHALAEKADIRVDFRFSYPTEKVCKKSLSSLLSSPKLWSENILVLVSLFNSLTQFHFIRHRYRSMKSMQCLLMFSLLHLIRTTCSTCSGIFVNTANNNQVLACTYILFMILGLAEVLNLNSLIYQVKYNALYSQF